MFFIMSIVMRAFAVISGESALEAVWKRTGAPSWLIAVAVLFAVVTWQIADFYGALSAQDRPTK